MAAPYPDIQAIYEEASFKTVYSMVRVGGGSGFYVQNVTDVSWQFEIGQVPTARVELAESGRGPFGLGVGGYANIALFAPIEIWIGFRAAMSFYMVQVFSGTIDSVSGETDARVIECVGQSRKLEVPYEDELIDLDAIDVNDAVKLLLEGAGVFNYRVDLPAWAVATVQHFELRFQTFGEAINKLSEVDGSPWYEMPSGQIRVDIRDTIPADTPARQYWSSRINATTPAPTVFINPPDATETQPVTAPPIENNDGLPRLVSANYAIFQQEVANRIIVTGANVQTLGPSGETNTDQIETSCDGDSDFVPTPPGFQVFRFQNELIDLAPKAASVCTRYFLLKNRLLTKTNATIEGDPELFLGATVQIEDWDYSGLTGMWFVEGYSCSLNENGFASQLTLLGGPGAGTTGQIDPFADFNWRIQDAVQHMPGVPQLPIAIPTDEGGGDPVTLDKPIGGAKYRQFVPTGTGTAPGDESIDPRTGLTQNPGGGADKVMTIITFDGGRSKDFDGRIVSYDWADDLGHFGHGRRFTVTYDPDDGFSTQMTLTVTDNDGRTDAVTKTVYIKVDPGGSSDPGSPTTDDPSLDDSAFGGGPVTGTGDGDDEGPTVVIFAAADAYAMCSSDGGLSWSDLAAGDAGLAGKVISVGAAPATWTANGIVGVFGTDAGEILVTHDCVAVDGVHVIPGAPSAILVVWPDTFEYGRWWLGTADGRIFTSTDNAESFELWKDFGDGYPINVIGTPPKFFVDDDFSMWVFGGDTGQPSSLVRIFPDKNPSHFDSLTYTGELADALAAAGPGFTVSGSSMNETSSLIAFNAGVSPRIWTAADPIFTPSTWQPATGVSGIDAAGPAAPGPESEYLVFDTGSTDTWRTLDDVSFDDIAGASPTAIQQVLWEGLQGVYLAAATGGIVKSTDDGTTFAYMRPNAGAATTWPGDAIGHGVALVIAGYTAAAPPPAGPGNLAIGYWTNADDESFAEIDAATAVPGNTQVVAPDFVGGPTFGATWNGLDFLIPIEDDTGGSNYRIQVRDKDGNLDAEFNVNQGGGGEVVIAPPGPDVAQSNQTGNYYVSGVVQSGGTGGVYSIKQYDSSGTFLASVEFGTVGSSTQPIATSFDGTIYVSVPDGVGGLDIFVFDESLTQIDTFVGLNIGADLDVDEANFLYGFAQDGGFDTIRKYDASGTLVDEFSVDPDWVSLTVGGRDPFVGGDGSTIHLYVLYDSPARYEDRDASDGSVINTFTSPSGSGLGIARLKVILD